MKRVILILVLASFLSGCQTAAPVTSPAVTEAVVPAEASPCVVSDQPLLYGMWQNDRGEVLVFTETTVYMVQLGDSGDTPYVREVWYDVQSVDWVNGVLTVMKRSIRINGEGAGFDMPLHYIKVLIDGETLLYGMGDEGTGIPETTDFGPFTKK